MADVGIVFQKMLVLLLMMSVGFAAGKTGIMTQQGNHCLSVLINKVTMPCMLLHASVCGERVLENGDVLLLTGLYFAGFALMIVLARLYRLALHPAREDSGVYELLMIFPNSAFIGIPVAAAIYGSTAVFGISLLNLPFYVALYCYGVSLIQGVPMGKVDLKQIFSPLMITSILGLALYLCNIRLPDLLAEPMQTIGQISTPGAMMLIGSTLADAACNFYGNFTQRDVKIYISCRIFYRTCPGNIAKAENICYIIFGMSSYDGGYTMNTQHLQYLIEIERTRSVSQAAENLFIGQPNLSRILHEMEANLGFKIFERTSKGVRSTERGAIFLQHAKSIIRELERIDALGPRHPVENRLRICIPRAAFILDLTADYLNTLPTDQNLDSVVRECHARQAIEMLENGEVEVGIIRFRSEYRDYFEEQSVSRGFGFQILSRYRYQLLLPQTHALADKQLITGQDLAGLPEIVHGDTFRKGPKVEEGLRRKIYTVDRLAQLRLLETIPGAYMWCAPIPDRCLARWSLVQKPSNINQTVYHDALVYQLQYDMTQIERGFVEFVQQRYQK